MMLLGGALDPLSTALLASGLSWRQQQFRSMHEHFVSTDPWILIRLCAGVGVILAIFILIKLSYHLQRHRMEVVTKAQPFALFVRIQAALGFSASDRWRMCRMAKALRLSHPAAVLISPALFDRAVAKYRPKPSQQAHFGAIRARLFGRP